MNRISLNVKSQRTKKSRFLQKAQEQADDSKNLRRETLYISVYECVNISTFALSVSSKIILFQILKVAGLLGGKFYFSVLPDFKFKAILITKPQKSSSTL